MKNLYVGGEVTIWALAENLAQITEKQPAISCYAILGYRDRRQRQATVTATATATA